MLGLGKRSVGSVSVMVGNGYGTVRCREDALGKIYIPQPSDPIKNITDEAVHKELGDSFMRAATTASSLRAKQNSETICGTIAQTKLESVSKHSNNSLLARGNTLQSDEDRLKLDELMALCTNLQNKVLDLEKTKTTQHNEIATQQKEIASLKRRVNQLEKKNKSRTHRPKRLYKVGLTARVESSRDEESLRYDSSKQGRIDAIDVDEEITLVSVQNDADKEMFDVDALNVEVINTAKLIIDVAQVSATGDIVSTTSIPLSAANAATTVSASTTTTATIIISGYKLKDLKLKEFDYIQEMFDRAFKRVNTSEDFRTELVEGKEKRAGTELIQEITNKQNVEDDKETTKLKQFMEINPDKKEVAIDAIPLAINQMLKSFERKDLEDLYKLIKAKYESTSLVKDLDLLLWGDLKSMFEPHVEDEVWKMQQGYKVLNWKLYDSCEVYSLMVQSMQIYMLVEKKYPLTSPTLLMMLEKKLQIDYESEMAYQLLKFIKKQLKK
nr:hypothetical protein [Tanacetum cinerariifolium]